uniref:PD-(D/E)XK nuclease family protein n=1 Tax=Caldisericum exile TaxID=693075 RepID=A0A7C4XZD3_9BACT
MEKFLLQKNLHKFSVSEILLMSKCKKALELKLKGHKVNFRYENPPYTGILFHKVINKFAKSLEKSLFNEINLKDADLQTFIKDRLYEIFIQEIGKDRKSSLDIVWNYLEDFSVLLFTLLKNGNDNLIEMFLQEEFSFEFELMENVMIHGRYDVLLKSGNKIKIIDYKTRKEDFERDTFQIALYYEAVKKTFGIKPEPVVMYFENGKISGETYTREEIEITLEVIKNLIAEFINEFEKGTVKPTQNKDICKYCNMRKYSFCKFT